MQYFIIFIISTFITFSLSPLNAQDNPDSLISNNNVKSIYEVRSEFEDGILKKIDTVGYKSYNQNFKLVEEFSKKFHSYKYQYEYSSNGLLTKKIEFDNQNYEKVKRVWLYKYDDKNRLIKEVSYWTDFKGKHPIRYSYNEQNHLITIEHINNKGKVFESIYQKYYESGVIYEKKHEEKYNKGAFKIKRFDKCGNLIYLYENGKEQDIYSFISLCPDLLKKEIYLIDTINTQNNSKQYVIRNNNRKSIYEYDSIGNLVQVAKFQFEENDTLNRSDEKTYNNKGQLIHFKEFYHWSMCGYELPTNETNIHEKYEYYQNGLLYKVHHFDETNDDKTNFVRNYITEYQIEFYE